MQQNVTTPQQTTTIAQKKAIVATITLFFALPVVILLRRKVGYRFMNPAMVLAMALLLFTYGSASMLFAGIAAELGQGNPVTGYIGTLFIDVFAVIVVVVYLIQRRNRWRDIKRGIPWHTYSRGVSLLSFIPLADNRIKRFVDPIACAIVGLVLLFIGFSYLAYYVIFAAACLFIFEAYDYEVQLNSMLDMLDSMVDSEVMSANVEYYSQPNPPQRPLDQTAGIPTGIAPDIQHQIERRRNRSTTLPNNLVVGAVATPRPTGSLATVTTLGTANGTPSTPQPPDNLPGAII